MPALRRQFRHDRNQVSLQNHQREELRLLSQFQQNVIDNASIWINVLDSQRLSGTDRLRA